MAHLYCEPGTIMSLEGTARMGQSSLSWSSKERAVAETARTLLNTNMSETITNIITRCCDNQTTQERVGVVSD